MVKEEHRWESTRYLNKAEEFLTAANLSLRQSLFNVAAFNAIQSIINANDSLTVSILGKRASTDHQEAMSVHLQTVRKIQDSSMRSVLNEALKSRSRVGYSGEIVKKDEAEKLLKNATLFLSWIKNYVK